jgi:hypothetical protein
MLQPSYLWICILNESTCVITHSVELDSNFFYCYELSQNLLVYSPRSNSMCQSFDFKLSEGCYKVIIQTSRQGELSISVCKAMVGEKNQFLSFIFVFILEFVY